MQGVSIKALKSSLELLYPVKLVLNDNNNRIQLDLIIVNEEHRGKGIAREVMETIISYSEHHRKAIELTPSGQFGGRARKLKKFYKKLGFKKNKNARSILHYAMIRKCQETFYN